MAKRCRAPGKQATINWLVEQGLDADIQASVEPVSMFTVVDSVSRYDRAQRDKAWAIKRHRELFGN